MTQDPLKVVSETLRTVEQPDDETMASIAVLSDRLEGLKERFPALASVGFSEDVLALQAQYLPAAAM